MTLHAIVSGTLVTAEAVPLGDHCARITSGHLPVGRRVVLGERWHLSPADAWTAEAHRLDQQADRAAHRARAASIEAERLTVQARVAMERAREVRGQG